MESYGTAAIAVGIGLGVVGFGLAVLLHRQAKRSANRKFTEEVARMDRQAAGREP